MSIDWNNPRTWPKWVKNDLRLAGTTPAPEVTEEHPK